MGKAIDFDSPKTGEDTVNNRHARNQGKKDANSYCLEIVLWVLRLGSGCWSRRFGSFIGEEMTINVCELPIDLKAHPKRRYVFQANITKNKSERQKQLGYFPKLKASVKTQVRLRDNYTCQICGEYGKEVDHIVPLRVSHDNSPENLRVLCVKCNLGSRLKRRDARLPYDEWYEALKRELQIETSQAGTPSSSPMALEEPAIEDCQEGLKSSALPVGVC